MIMIPKSESIQVHVNLPIICLTFTISIKIKNILIHKPYGKVCKVSLVSSKLPKLPLEWPL